MSTYMWKTERKVYRIQTDDPSIVRKLSRRSKPTLVGIGENKYLYIFELRNIRQDNAIRTLGHISGQEVIYIDAECEYELKPHSHMNMNDESQTSDLPLFEDEEILV